MSIYEKARIKLTDPNTGQVLKEVDPLTSADAVTCDDGEAAQVKFDNIKSSMENIENEIGTIDNTIVEIKNTSSTQGTDLTAIKAKDAEQDTRLDNAEDRLDSIDQKNIEQDNRLTAVEDTSSKLTTDMNNIKAGNNGIGYLKNSVTITAPATQVEIGIDFNKDLDVLFVFKNTTYIEQGINYEYSSDGKYIFPKNDTWTGSVDTPTVFNFLMFKATPMNQLEIDGGIIADGTLNFSKFDAYTQNLIMKIPAERITGGIFGGIVKAQTNTQYTTAQLRNVIMSTTAADATKMNNGDIWIVYQ